MRHERRYSDYLRELENSLEKHDLEMKEYVFANYSVFIDTFKELRRLDCTSLEEFNSAIQAIEEAMSGLLQPLVHERRESLELKKVGSAEWWMELPDEVDMLLAEENYDRCISLIQQTKRVPVSPYTTKHKLEFDVYVLKVIESISKQVQRGDDPARFIGYLKELNALDTAEEAFYNSKTVQLLGFMKKQGFAGDPIKTIGERGAMFFSLLRKTASEGRTLSLGSARLYIWMQHEISRFSHDIGEHLYLIEDVKSLSLVINSLFKSCKSLEAHGLKLDWFFNRTLLPHLQQRVQEIYAKNEIQILQEVASDSWKTAIHQVDFNVIRLTASGIYLFKVIELIIEDTSVIINCGHNLISAGLAPIFVKVLSSLIDTFIQNDAFEQKTDWKTVVSIVCNLWNISALIPSITEKIGKALGVNVDASEFSISQESAVARGTDILKHFIDLKWTSDFSRYSDTLNTITMLRKTDEFDTVYNMDFIVFMKDAMNSVSSSTDRNNEMIYLCSKIMVESFNDRVSEFCTECKINGYKNLPPGGMQQFVCDYFIFYILSQEYGEFGDVKGNVNKLVEEYAKSTSFSADILIFSPSIYHEIYKTLDLR